MRNVLRALFALVVVAVPLAMIVGGMAIVLGPDHVTYEQTVIHSTEGGWVLLIMGAVAAFFTGVLGFMALE